MTYKPSHTPLYCPWALKAGIPPHGYLNIRSGRFQKWYTHGDDDPLCKKDFDQDAIERYLEADIHNEHRDVLKDGARNHKNLHPTLQTLLLDCVSPRCNVSMPETAPEIIAAEKTDDFCQTVFVKTSQANVGIWEYLSESPSIFHDALSDGCENVSLRFAQFMRGIMETSNEMRQCFQNNNHTWYQTRW